jgi:putative hydroxymethylpyrimidine transport system ATP-binding protein
MAQNDLLIPWATVSDNVSLGNKLRGEKFSSEKKLKIIEKVGLMDHKKKYPFQLSGGQRQRAALARTLMENTPIVLLDEPFGSLDSNTREEMIDLTFESLKGKTVLFVTHDPHEAARLCESIYILGRQKTTSNKSLKPPFPKTYSDKLVFDLQYSLLEKIKSNRS